jgi:hypothetical protein
VQPAVIRESIKLGALLNEMAGGGHLEENAAGSVPGTLRFSSRNQLVMTSAQ